MRSMKRWALPALVFVLAWSVGRAQTVVGQYEDEAAVRTWNTFGVSSAAAFGLGETRYALALDSTAVFSNPALATRLPNLCLTLNGSYGTAEFFRYAVVNTGVVSTSGNLSLGLWAFDSAAVTLRLGGWGIGLGYGLLESYGRPKIDITVDPTYSFHFDQTGELKVLNFSLARSLGSRLSLGIGLNVLTGELSRLTQDDLSGGFETITTSVSQKFSGFFVNGGLVFDVTDSLHLAAVARAPFVKKSDSRSLISFALGTGLNISTQGSSADEYREPFAAGLGLSYDISPEWFAALDATYIKWSDYKVTFFGEDQPRNFRDVVRLSLGTEYSASFTLFGWDLRLPVRGGIQFDPQPMKEPVSSYFYYSFGTGLHGKHFFLDVSLMTGKESGSGHSLAAKWTAVSLGATL